MGEKRTLPDFPDVTFTDGLEMEDVKNMYLQAMKEKYKEITGKDLVMHDADPIRLIAYANCLLLFQIVQYAERAGKLSLLKYSYGDYLENIGALKGIHRIKGAAARTNLKFTLSMKRNHVTTIPVGTRVTESGGVYFETQENLDIPAGDMTGMVAAVCKEIGEMGNGYEAGSLCVLVDPVAYVESVENTIETEGGADLESDENLAERIYLAPSAWSTAGPDDAYKYWTRTFDPAIFDVRVESSTPGIVEIYFLMQDGELPDVAMTDALEKYLHDENVRPLTDKVVVQKPEAVEYAVNMTYYINESDRAKATMIQGRVQEAVKEFVKWQRERIGRDVNPDQLRRMVVNAGAKRVEVTAPEYRKIPYNGVAVLEMEAEVLYGGIEDD